VEGGETKGKKKKVRSRLRERKALLPEGGVLAAWDDDTTLKKKKVTQFTKEKGGEG